MIEYLKAFFRAVADFFASLAAKYKIYVERENAKARAEAKANAVAMAEQAMLTDYQVVADIIATANNNLALADPNVLRPVNDFRRFLTIVPFAPAAPRMAVMCLVGASGYVVPAAVPLLPAH